MNDWARYGYKNSSNNKNPQVSPSYNSYYQKPVLQKQKKNNSCGVIDLQSQHDLENSWSYWYDKYIGPGKTAKEYSDAMHLVGTFDSIQGFWCWHNNIPIDLIPGGSSFHLMKSGIRPVWEDTANEDGGTLSFRVNKDSLIYVWMRLSIYVIGEQISTKLADNDDICGISMSMRKNEVVISVWNKKASLLDIKHFRSLIHDVLTGVVLEKESYRVHKNLIHNS